MVLKHLSMDSGLRRRFKSVLLSSMCRYSMLQVRARCRCAQISARSLSSSNIAFLVGLLLPSVLTPLLTLLAVACTRMWGNLSVSLGHLIRLTIALFLCNIVGRSGQECKCSKNLKRDCESTSQLCGLTLGPKTGPISMHSVWPKECAWAATSCGCVLKCRNSP